MDSPFFIFGHQRCGSHLLADLLDSHPEITMYDEWYAKKMDPSKNQVFPLKNPHEWEAGEGFIVMYQHFLKNRKAGRGNKLRKLMQKSPVIHLYRDDLDAHAESCVRLKKGEVIHTKERVSRRTGHIPDSSIQKQRKLIMNYRDQVPWKKFESLYEISYERVTGGNGEVTSARLDDLCEFLGIEKKELTTDLKKVNK